MSDLATIGTYSVFVASYVVFALGKFPGMKIDRPGAAVIGAVLMFTFGAVRTMPYTSSISALWYCFSR